MAGKSRSRGILLLLAGVAGGIREPRAAWAHSGGLDLPGLLSNYFPEMPFLLIILTFFFFLCLIEGLYLLVFDPVRRQKRQLKKRLNYLEGLQKKISSGSLLKTDSLQNLAWLRRFLKRTRHLEQLQELLVQADVNLSLSTFLMVVLVAGGTGLSLGFFARGPLGALAGGGLGFYLPFWVLFFKRKLRLKKFEKQLPEALDLLARGLKAGHAFATGLQMVGQEMPDPIGVEFFKTFKEYNHGLDLNTALLNLCKRVRLRELRFFATAVMIQRETGGNLVDILEKIASLIRERFKLRNQIKALTAEGRLSGLILICLPPLVFLIMMKINPPYAMLLIQHPSGRKAALVALLFQALGVLTIRKIVNIRI